VEVRPGCEPAVHVQWREVGCSRQHDMQRSGQGELPRRQGQGGDPLERPSGEDGRVVMEIVDEAYASWGWSGSSGPLS
jgi:hypothetical protein